ncbi:tetratricopeptide repeat protein, partial [Streptomyces sp. NRRL S-495]|uniref:tetratricopeptide repeat protein n=1 Tax=Streptomyces sp. NRRL S-495 TaxID=1609133 RepID=UPI0006963436
AYELAARLGGLPLALRLAGTYLDQSNRTPPPFRAPATPTTYTGYLRAWEDGLDRLDPGQVLARTWAMSVALLEQRGHGHARALLELLAAFADADLPYTHLLTPERLADAGPLAVLDGPAIWQHLTALAALGLVELPDAAPDTPPVLRMHPLVRDASRTPDAEADAARLLIATALADDSREPEDPRSWPLWRLLRPLILDAFQRADAARLTEEALPRLSEAVNMAGRHLMVEGLNAQARAAFEAVLAVERERVGATHPNVLLTRYNRALVLRDLGESTQARAELEAVLAAEREQFGETHVDVLITRHELACVLYVEGDLAVAKAEFEEVLAALRGVLEDTAPEVLATRHELARVLGDLGDLAAARAEFEEILAVMRESQGVTHPAALATRHELARLLRDQGELAPARAEFETVLAVERERLGDTHPSTLLTRYSLALVLRDQGELTQAREELEAVLAVEADRLGPDHPDTQITRRSLDGVLRMLEGR